MIADGPGNCLTPEEHANVALLGQASGIAQLCGDPDLVRAFTVSKWLSLLEDRTAVQAEFHKSARHPGRHSEIGPG